MSPRDAVLELLTENLPPGLVPAAGEKLRAAAAAEFAAAGLPCPEPEACGTCRRLALYFPALAPVPAKKLAEVFPRVLRRLEAGGGMAWEPSGFRFHRPVRGLLALHGERQVSFAFCGLKSGRFTEGHDASGPRRVGVPSAEKYFRTLEHSHVLVRDSARLAALRSCLAAAAARMKLGIEVGEDLLRETLYLAEYPVAVVSGFSQEFLRLQPQALRSALLGLKLFPVSDGSGRLQPYFAGIRDGASKGQRAVEEGFRAAAEERLAALAAQSLPR